MALAERLAVAPYIVNLSTTVTGSAFQNEIYALIRAELIKKMPEVIDRVRIPIRDIIYHAVINQDVGKALLKPGGGLPGQLGLGAKNGGIPPRIAVEITAAATASTLEIKYLPSGATNTYGQLDVSILRKGYGPILRNVFAKYPSRNKAGRRTVVEWLKWLLLRGTDIVVKDYQVKKYNTTNINGSRSGAYLMVQRGKRSNSFNAPLSFGHDPKFAKRVSEAPKTGLNSYTNGFSIPQKYSGTAKKNWLTEAFTSDDTQKRIANAIDYAMSRVIA